MESLSTRRQKQYEALKDAIGEPGVFTQERLMAELRLRQDEAAKFLTDLENAGYVREEQDEIDRRIHHYHFLSSEALVKAEKLNHNLEDRRKQTRDTPPLAEAIDRIWVIVCQSMLATKVELKNLPDHPGRLTLECAAGNVRLDKLGFVKNVRLDHLDKKDAAYATEVLKLFDASGNAYRSVTNVLLYFKKLEKETAEGKYTLPVADYAVLDGIPSKPVRAIPNKSLCPICRRFKQTHNALALISGNPKMDSAFQVYHGTGESTRTSMKICSYCFLSGYVDIPAALITKTGQGVNKGREYLFITTPLGRNKLEKLLDYLSASQPALDDDLAEGVTQTETETTDDEIDENERTEAVISVEPVTSDEEEGIAEREEDPEMAMFYQFLQEVGAEAYEKYAVLGLSRKRLRELRGFILPGASGFQRVITVRVPVERLVGEAKISGAVRRELVKATMYDFWRITGGSLHYNRIIDAPFSIDGQPIELEEMYRANVAYHIVNRYARVGKYQQLNSGLFMLLLFNSREAANTILRSKHRVRKYAPGIEKVKEVIELTEKIAQKGWKFELGLRIVATLVDVGLLLKAKGFRSGKGPNDVYTGTDLVKWLQRIKMIRDETSARAWGNMLLNALKRGDLAYKGYILSKGGQISAPGEATIRKILDLVEGEDGIIQTCARQKASLSEVSRQIANMDYYLLFYYNQQQANQQTEGV